MVWANTNRCGAVCRLGSWQCWADGDGGVDGDGDVEVDGEALSQV